MNDEPQLESSTAAGPANGRRSPPSRTRGLPNPKDPAPGRMFVVGRVLDPQGKPVPNA